MLDDAQNSNPASAVTPNILIDTIAPTVSILEELGKDDEFNAAFDLTVQFSEPVYGFEVPQDLTVELLTPESGVTSASPIAAVALKSGADGSAVYVLTITPNTAGAEGEVVVTVNANIVQDKAMNMNSNAVETDLIPIDTIAPTVEITGAPGIEKNDAFDLTVTFSEDVNGFAVPADLMITGPAMAALTSGSDGDDVYVVTITPNATSEDDVTVMVNANTVQDLALNDNTASNTPSVHVDTMPPTVLAIEGVPTMEQNGAYDLTIRFSEEVNGFSVADDLTVGLVPEPGVTSASPIAAVAWKSGVDGDAVYVVTVTPNAAGAEGDVTVTVNANTVQDFALNANPTGSNAAAVHVDTIAPTVSVSGFPTIEKNVPYDLTVTFSELVNGFAVPADLDSHRNLSTAALDIRC